MVLHCLAKGSKARRKAQHKKYVMSLTGLAAGRRVTIFLNVRQGCVMFVCLDLMVLFLPQLSFSKKRDVHPRPA